MTLIGIGCASRVGKDTAADALCRTLGYRKIAFADKLKELAMEADPIVVPAIRITNVDVGHGRLEHTVRSWGGWEKAKDNVREVRPFLERLGDGCRRVFGEEFWIKQALGNYTMHDVPEGDIKIVVSDVRKRNEADYIKQCDGKLIRIDRPGYAARDFEWELTDYDGWDAVINNAGSIQDLEEKIVETVQGWIRGGPVLPRT